MSTEEKAAQPIDPHVRKAVAEQLGAEVEQKIHADALRMSERRGWEIEAGPITEARLSPYMSVGYSIRYFGGTFRLVQRVPEGKAGYEEAFNRARLIASAPTLEEVNKELLQALRNAKIYFIGLAAYLATCNTDVIVENLETTIESIHSQEREIEALIAKARGI